MAKDDFQLDEESSTVDWSERFHAYLYLAKQLLKKYWWIVILTTGLGVSFQVYRAVQIKPTYSSNAVIMLSQFTANIGNADALREQYANWFGNQALILSSADVRRAAEERVKQFHPELKPVGVNIQPSQIPETTAIQVWAHSDSREYTQLYLDAVIDEYMNRRQQMKGETSDVALTALTERLLALEDEIAAKEEAVVDFQKKNNLSSIKEQREKAGTNVAQLRARQADFRTQIRLLDTLGIDYELRSPDLLSQRERLSGDAAANYHRTLESLNQLRAELDEFSHYLKPRHPKIISINREIERTKNLVEIYRKQATEQIVERKAQLLAEMENLDIVISEQENIALENSRLDAEFERLSSILQRSRNLYENLIKQMQSLEMGQEMSTEVVSVFQRAGTPRENAVSVKEHAVQGGMLGAMAGIGIIALIALIDSRIVSGDDIRKRFDSPVFAVIPLEERNDDGRLELLAAKDRRHLFAEACRTLRSSLFFMGEEGNRPNLMLVTSSIPEEGKSTIAANLAAAISFTSARVLLVDCDLRRGQLASAFGLPAFPGMSDLLQKGRKLDAVVQKTSHENLDFVAAGEYPERPGELLLSLRMDEVLKEMRSLYDFVILDTAPILATDDTTGFAVKSDALLFVARSGYTQGRQIRTAVERLQMRGVDVSGFVLNCVDVRGTDYYYYKKYNDYYAYSTK